MRSFRRRKPAAWLLVIVLSATTHPVQAQAAASHELGLVIGIDGVWSAHDKALKRGDTIPPGEVSGPAQGRLVVWFEGTPPKVYQCHEKPCNPSITRVEAPVQNQSLWDRLLKHEDRYITAASRGLEGDLREAVIPLDGPQMDITSALRDLEPATYWVRFEAIDHPSEAGAPMQVQWASGKAAAVSAADLKPGLYRLALVEPSGEPTGSDAWILLSAKERYPAQSVAFHQTVDMVAAWPLEADPIVARAVLRAALESLATQPNAPSKP
jgi:hypothetical protein